MEKRPYAPHSDTAEGSSSPSLNHLPLQSFARIASIFFAARPVSGMKCLYVRSVVVVIGSIRRECLDQIVIFNERHLRHVLASYVDYYHRARTDLSLDKDCPHSRPVQPLRTGRVIAIRQVGGLHHCYQRLAA